jgi:hypothetical protein
LVEPNTVPVPKYMTGFAQTELASAGPEFSLNMCFKIFYQKAKII